MYPTSEKWKELIYTNVQPVMNIYIDDVLINPDYIFNFKKGGEVFDEELTLGSTPSQYIELEIHKSQFSTDFKTIRVEYGILTDKPLTVAEVHKMLVGKLNRIKVKSLSKNYKGFEVIPLGIYNIDSYTDNEDTVTIKALDNMIKFEFNYDGSDIITQKGYATLKEVAEDICKKAKIELGSTSFLNMDKRIAVYDNTITAREYIGYIAESAGCFAVIGRDNKLYFRKIGQDEAKIDINYFADYEWSDEFKISKVSYEDGVRSFKFGDETRNNLWISQDNVYIVDEEQVKAIYDELNELTINSFNGKSIIDPAIDIGDKLIIDGKPVIYQGEMTFESRFIAEISSMIQIKAKEETTVKRESQKSINRKVRSEIDQENLKITQLVQEQTEQSEKMSKVEQTVDGIKQDVKSMTTVEIEGQNLLKNTQFKEKVVTYYNETEEVTMQSPKYWGATQTSSSGKTSNKDFYYCDDEWSQYDDPVVYTVSTEYNPDDFNQPHNNQEYSQKSPYKNWSCYITAVRATSKVKQGIYQKVTPSELNVGDIYSASANFILNWYTDGEDSYSDTSRAVVGIAFTKDNKVISKKEIEVNLKKLDTLQYCTYNGKGWEYYPYDKPQTWQKVNVSLEVPEGAEDIYFYIEQNGVLGLQMADMILNKGTPASWSPAEGETMSYEEYHSLIAQTAEEIRQQVEAQDGRINEFVSTVDSTVRTISKDVQENLIVNSDFKVRDKKEKNAPANFSPTGLFGSSALVWRIQETKTPNGNNSVMNGSGSWDDNYNLTQTIDISLDDTDEEKYFTFSCMVQYHQAFTEVIAELDIIALDESGSEIANEGYVEQNFIGSGNAKTWYEISIVKQIPNNAKKLVAKLIPKIASGVYFGDLCLVGGSKVSSWKLSRKDYSTIAQTADLISLTVQKGEFGTMLEVNSEHVRIAWNNISKSIQYESDASMNIYDGDKLLMKLSDSGLNLYNSSQKPLMDLTSAGMQLYDTQGLLLKLADNGLQFYKNNKAIYGLIATKTADGSHLGLSMTASSDADFLIFAGINKNSPTSEMLLGIGKNGALGNDNGIYFGMNVHGNNHTLDNINLVPNTIKVNTTDGLLSGFSGPVEIMTNFEVAKGTVTPRATFTTFYFGHGVLLKRGDDRVVTYPQLGI